MSATNQPPHQSRLLQSTSLSTLNSLVDNHFESAICLNHALKGPNAMLPECLHRFCDTCIKNSIQQCGIECPTWRARITSRRDLRKDQLVGDIVSENNVVLVVAALFDP